MVVLGIGDRRSNDGQKGFRADELGHAKGERKTMCVLFRREKVDGKGPRGVVVNTEDTNSSGMDWQGNGNSKRRRKSKWRARESILILISWPRFLRENCIDSLQGIKLGFINIPQVR